MKFKCNNHGDKRIIKRFLFFPMTVIDDDNKKSTLWLETVIIHQKYIETGTPWGMHRYWKIERIERKK